MWNPVSLRKHYCPDPGLSRRLAAALGLALAASAAGPAVSGETASSVPAPACSVAGPPSSAAIDLPVPGTPSPAHLRLFTPLAAPPGAYIVTVMAEPIAAARRRVMTALGVAEAPAAGPGAPAPVGAPPAPWAVRRLEPAEAFGASGPYEPIRLARLFDGRRAEVARGPVVRDGRAVASVTLISPYPDPAFSRLEPGTLVIVLRL